jgi:ribosome-binding ATPase YchF (GTP1/OBG family)
VALEVGIVGLPNAGKTSLFNALTHAGAEITAYATVAEKANVGMAVMADERLGQLAEVVSARKITPAAIRVVDVPGSGRALLGNLRQVDAILAVLNGWAPDADPGGDLETIRLELLLADREHVERRIERVQKQAKSGDTGLREELAELERVLAHLDGERPLSDYAGELPPSLEPLTTKPLLGVENGSGGIDVKLEAELAELPEEEAAAFREGEAEGALDHVVTRLSEAVELITFFTAGDKETRAWTLRRGQTALEAAESIHSDIARGFIRCEVIRWGDLVECGSHAEASKRGLQRLEGKTYAVEDGDVLNIRFSPPR